MAYGYKYKNVELSVDLKIAANSESTLKCRITFEGLLREGGEGGVAQEWGGSPGEVPEREVPEREIPERESALRKRGAVKNRQKPVRVSLTKSDTDSWALPVTRNFLMPGLRQAHTLQHLQALKGGTPLGFLSFRTTRYYTVA